MLTAAASAAQRVDSEQIGKDAVVHGDDDGRDLWESDQLEPVESFGAGLVVLHLRE
jgi:hypothetical protein